MVCRSSYSSYQSFQREYCYAIHCIRSNAVPRAYLICLHRMPCAALGAPMKKAAPGPGFALGLQNDTIGTEMEVGAMR